VLELGPDKEIHAVPTYQYSCTECGSALEAQQSFSDDPLSVCPECGGRLRKVFSAVGVVFKGSGFYRNDSRAGKNGDAVSTTSSDSDKSSSSKSSSDSGKSGSSDSSSASDSSSSSGSSAKETAKAGSSA
jgi:putative FmdB family regulatory protein